MKPEPPTLVDGRGNVVIYEENKLILKKKDGTEYVLPDDIDELAEKVAQYEKVFEEKFVFSGDGKGSSKG